MLRSIKEKHSSAIKRYFVRVTSLHTSLCKEEQNMHRIQIRLDCIMFLQLFIDGYISHSTLLDVVNYDGDDVLHCWKMYSNFVVLLRRDVYSLESIMNLESINFSQFLEFIIFYVICNRSMSRCLVLSWFDRFDRMILWTCLTNFNRDTIYIANFVKLVIFIHEYL
jgi:hypothetical protein